MYYFIISSILSSNKINNIFIYGSSLYILTNILLWSNSTEKIEFVKKYRDYFWYVFLFDVIIFVYMNNYLPSSNLKNSSLKITNSKNSNNKAKKAIRLVKKENIESNILQKKQDKMTSNNNDNKNNNNDSNNKDNNSDDIPIYESKKSSDK